MKKLICCIICILMVLSSFICVSAESQPENSEYHEQISIPEADEVFTVSDDMPLNECLNRAYDNSENEYTKIIIPSGRTEKILNSLIIYSNTIIEAQGAVIVKDYSSANKVSQLMTNGGKDKENAGGYSLTRNVYINGGKWSGGNIENAENISNLMTFVHAENIFIQNLEFENVKGGHALEFNSVKNGVIQGCSFNGTIRPQGNISSMAVQIDIAHDCLGEYSKYKEHELCGDHKSTPASYLTDDTVCQNIRILNNKFNTESTIYQKFSQGIGTGRSIINVIDGKFGFYQSDIEIKGNIIKDNEKSAIQVAGIENLKIEDNFIENCDMNGIAVKKSKGGYIKNNTITCKTRGIHIYSNDEDGIYSSLDYISNNIIEGGPIALSENTNVGSIYENTVKNSVSRGIFLNSSVCGDIYLNTITNSASGAVVLSEKSKSGNVFENKINDSLDRGIFVSNSEVTGDIYSNTIENTAENGIYLYSNSKCSSIRNNTILNCKENAVYLLNNSFANAISDNIIRNSDIGLKIYNAKSGKVSGNEIDTAIQYGIYSKNSDISEITGHKIIGCKKSGIAVTEGKVSGSISDNEIKDSTEHAITLYSNAIVGKIERNAISKAGKNGISVNASTIAEDVSNNILDEIVSAISMSNAKSNNILSNKISSAQNGIYINSNSVINKISGNAFEKVNRQCYINSTAKVSICDIKDSIPVTDIKTNVSSVTVNVGKTYTVLPTVYPSNANATVYYKVYNSKVATVTDTGVIKGVSSGQTNVTIKAGNKYVKVLVTVRGPASKVSLSKKSAVIGVGEKLTVTSKLSPKYTYDKVKYDTSNKKIATVSGSGVIKGVKAGKVTITAKAGKVSAKIVVTVKKAPKRITLNKKELKLKKGKKYNLKYSLPKNTASYKITYSSSNKKVASVDSNGCIKALKKGKANIAVKTFNNKRAVVKVIIK